MVLKVQNDTVEKLHSFKDMTRAYKIENEETTWCFIFQVHKKEFRKEHIFLKSPNEPIREAWHAAVHGGHKESDITGRLNNNK